MRPEVSRPNWKLLASASMALLVAGCGSMSRQQAPSMVAQTTVKSAAPVLPPANSGRGAYYQDDGPGDQIPGGLEGTPDAEPRVEPYSTRANRPYVQFGKTYTPITDNRPFTQRGIGSWYGKKFHGNKTSSGEPYDMFKMTAAHPTLPIPSYARVTHLDSGRQIIVRVNDRGPFHSSRIIDLSYTAALKLGYLGKGSGMLEVEHLSPQEIERIAQARRMSDGAALATLTADKHASGERDTYPPLPDMLLQDKDPMPRQAVAVTAVQSQPVASGYFIQLGAFAQAQNAESMRAQYAIAWAERMPPAAVVPSGTHYRLMAGPFETREKAAEAARQVQEGGGGKPIVVQR